MSPGSNPRLIKAQLDSIQSAVSSLLQDANKVISEIEDPKVRRALVSLSGAVDLMNTLLVIALEPYRQELEERLDPQI
ncbi:hypothetical protein A2V54_02445 [candidate division WWE3 bacterium RBG_19FT_COMBO_53_11]|uniref:Uncharacterized protein n=1 Tax=candidate division WWE3 bacterium RBG_19FT_COMBO_53_11 TaxID=1802613 RepID=A0A1F4UH52_UNCKA|nr:MAG: hypothetical protein A2155_01850 [candidate division WWE3 bacterium RBG_16_52_45]OGC44271.1 MAG: hypothetical protein A2V54_02445 [candidate division WWE3 bacterium RBG_19FT_COMBO_53_11]